MATFGRFGTFPRRFGGGGTGVPHLNRCGAILNSLNAQQGTAYDTTSSSTVYVRNISTARVLDAVWSGNQRLANQYQPTKITDFLHRWETLLGLYPLATDSLSARRKRVAAAIARMCSGNTYQSVADTLLALLTSSVFLGIVHSASGSALVYTPSGWPVGTVDSTGKHDWMSTVAYLAIRVQQPSWMDDQTFYSVAGSIYPALDAIVPSWVTFDWFRWGTLGNGFFLDDTWNLDNEAFDV